MFIVELTIVEERSKRSFEEGMKRLMLWNCEKYDRLTTDISNLTLALTGSTNYELWKLKTQAWTVVIYLSREKRAMAVSLSLPKDDKKKKEKVFGELKLDGLNSENGISYVITVFKIFIWGGISSDIRSGI